MKVPCEIVRDLLPLYLDGIASAPSRQMVETHFSECKECNALFSQMKNNTVENEVEKEKNDVIARQRRFFKRKSALVGGVLAGIFMIPILICLIVNLTNGAGLTWFFIVLTSLLVAASLTVVPLVAPADKFLWTLGTFSASLIMLLGVCCIYTGGQWFFVASSASIFGIGTVFLPFAVRSKVLSAVLKNQKGLAVMIADTVLYIVMMFSIGIFTKAPDFFRISAAISLPMMAYVWVIFVLLRYAGKNRWLKAGLCAVLSGTFLFFADALIGLPMGLRVRLPVFSPFVWNLGTIDGNVKWLALIGGILIGVCFILIGLIHGRKQK